MTADDRARFEAYAVEVAETIGHPVTPFSWESGCPNMGGRDLTSEWLFVQAATVAEREACAERAEHFFDHGDPQTSEPSDIPAWEHGKMIAAAIRARGEEPRC